MSRLRLRHPDPLEKEVQAAIMEYLAYRKIFCWKEHSGGLPMDGGEWLMPIGLRGKSDILGVLPGGRFLAIEVKRRTGAVRPEQQEFIDNVNRSGGLAFVARSVDDVMARGV